MNNITKNTNNHKITNNKYDRSDNNIRDIVK